VEIAGGLIGLVIFALHIWAIINVLMSTASTGAKVLWTLLLLFVPIVPLIVWFFIGPRKA
jgi:hypothetical protein